MKHHPEQQDDEIYIGNIGIADESLPCSWKTIRTGKTPLMRDGSEMPPIMAAGCKPWFIKTSEVEARLEEEKGKEKACEITIGVFERMLENGCVG